MRRLLASSQRRGAARTLSGAAGGPAAPPGGGGGVAPPRGLNNGGRDARGASGREEAQRSAIPWVRTVISGVELLRNPKYNKGMAFTEQERDRLYLRGARPPAGAALANAGLSRLTTATRDAPAPRAAAAPRRGLRAGLGVGARARAAARAPGPRLESGAALYP